MNEFSPMSKKKKTIVIIDAHAVIHRAYHAIPSFTNSEGTPTGALYGIASMLIRIIEEFRPEYIVAAYDLPKPTFRHHAYESYKSTRIKADEELVAQIELSREIFLAFGVPCLDAEGFEADDIIGTLVEQLKPQKDLSIIIASGDMDTLQLVEATSVQVFTLKKGITDTVLYNEAAVVERYGFAPKQLTDYKGLRGDPSDNIIGVPGIGEKTATTIIQTFGSIENLYSALEKDDKKVISVGLSERVCSILREHKDDALFSKTLATIRRDAPVIFTLPHTVYRQALDTESLLAVLNKYEFRSLIPRVRKLFSLTEAPPSEPVNTEVLEEASVAMWVLYSEETTPTIDAIFARTKTKNLPDAYQVILEQLKKQNLLSLFENIEKPLIPIIKEMSRRGVLIDKDHFLTVKTKLSKALKIIEDKVTALCGECINLNSPKQLSELLFTKLSLKPKGKRKASGAFTTNAETLEGLREDHEVIPLILEYREMQKLLTTYVEALLGYIADDGRVHASFYQHGTTTGRFSSANPNLQNLPTKGELAKEIRHGFMAPDKYVFIGADYSQIELRVLAILSKDSKLINTFKRGEDIHSSVASSMFAVPLQEVTSEMRRVAKVINFGILFGMGVTALSKNLDTTREKAQEFYTNYFQTFPNVARFLEETKEKAKTQGYTETIFGRRRYFPAINSSAPFLRALAERTASNAPIQGSEADILKIAILLINQDLRSAGLHERVHLILQVHDELIYEAEKEVAIEAKRIIEEAMVSVFSRSPIPVDVPPIPITISSETGTRLDELK